ncbi:MAG: hypothetical protein HXY20_01790 [Acidobacteria bacterium]|nr:hypothetical protein [Acidobacteriota bacterium]
MLGRIIAHYRIVETLGDGGMGVIHKARDTRLDRLIAIEIPPPEKVSNPERKRRFIPEARSASSLNHPNIVTIYDIDQSGGTDFTAMEFVQGQVLGIVRRTARPSGTNVAAGPALSAVREGCNAPPAHGCRWWQAAPALP